MKRKPYRYLLYILLELASFIVILLPYRLAVILGGFFGGIAYYILPKYRNIALENLRLSFSGEKSEKEIEQIAREVFRNFGRTAMECLNARKLNRENIKNLFVEEDYDPIKRILSEGKGVIVLASHFGNWEMSSIGAAAFGIDVTILGKRIYYPPFNKFLVSLREDKGVKTFYRDEKNVLRKSLNVLKSNEVLGMAPDQDVDSVDGIFVEFFGRPAYTPIGPVVIAMLSGAPILPTFMIRRGKKFRLYVEKPIYVEKSGNKERDILNYTREWSSAVERFIRENSSHWAWMHRRWKTKPKASGNSPAMAEAGLA